MRPPQLVPPPAEPPALLHCETTQSDLSANSSRFGVVLQCFLAFVICNVDRISMSVSIIPMADSFGWSASTQGLVQSAFFLGYMATPIPGGILADTHGGRRVLAMAVFLWSVCTFLTPLASSASFSALLLMRAALGAGEGLAMPAMNALVSEWVPVEEIGRSLSFIYSGMYGGSILGLLTAPAIIARSSWPAVFYVFGTVGMLWVVWFCVSTKEHGIDRQYEILTEHDSQDIRTEHCNGDSTSASQYQFARRKGASHDQEAQTRGEGMEDETNVRAALTDVQGVCIENTEISDMWSDPIGHEPIASPQPSVSTLLTYRCVWAIIIAHFCCTWGYFVLLTWLPTFFFSKFDVDLAKSATLSAVPWLCMFIFANVGGVIADLLIRNNVTVTHTRKIMQSIGFIGPAIFLGLLCTAKNDMYAMSYASLGLACASFSQSGVYCNHQDIGPPIAGTLLGISNTFASLPGVVGVYITGVVLDLTENNWSAVFGIAIGIYCFGLIVYVAFATSERQW